MGTRDILDAERGAVIAPNDPVAFGNGLAALISNRYQLDTLAAEGRDYALEWAAPVRARQLADLYRSLVASIT
jgi:glycosyltransferase involved in cell wall biosynthesis